MPAITTQSASSASSTIITLASSSTLMVSTTQSTIAVQSTSASASGVTAHIGVEATTTPVVSSHSSALTASSTTTGLSSTMTVGSGVGPFINGMCYEECYVHHKPSNAFVWGILTLYILAFIGIWVYLVGSFLYKKRRAVRKAEKKKRRQGA